VVDAADTNVRAVDTSFVIRRLARQAVAVTVRQGSVDINRSGSGRVSSHRVFANMRAVSPASTADIVTSAVTPSDVTRELAWREGMLSFEDMPLRNAADQFARYSGRQIVFADPSIGDETVTGLFAANDPAGFARSVALSLDLKADAGAGAVVLRR
jgi:transmembrane sensor